MKVRKNISFTIFLLLALGVAQFAMPSSVFAAGTVGDGTAGSCTESALNTALSGGGLVTFNCGASPVTITLTSTKVISSNTQINGGGLVTLNGNNSVRVFEVSTGIDFDVTGLKVINGFVTNPDPGAVPLPLGGGAMLINASATVDIVNSTFDGNNVVNAYGGAIYVNDGTLNITNSTFSNNSADVDDIGVFALGGGAIENNDGTVTITGSTFNGNSVISASGDGGAIYNGDFDGGVATPDGNVDTLSISNSTFYNNTLAGDTDGSSGGAIRSNSDATIIHSTFSNNESGVSQIGGESGTVTLTDGNVVLQNNIFANSTSFSGAAYDCAKRDGVDGFTVSGNIIVSNFSCGTPFSTDDPNLGTLQDNGGPTLTIDFTAATDATDAVACAGGLTADQRGVVRPTGASCDIGALEVDRFQPTVTINQAAGQVDPTNGSVNFTVVFNETMTGFTTGDVSFTGSSVGGTLTGTVTGGPTTFNVAVTGMTTPGNIVASINAGVATDTALNANVVSSSSDNTVAYDATGPSVTIDKAAAQDDPTNNSTVNFEVVFNESVTGFNESDVTYGGTANPTTMDVTGSGTTYNVAIGGFGANGTVTASVNAGAVSDALGNPSSASTTASVTYDTIAPTVTINQAAGQSDPAGTGDESIDFTVVFNEPVSNFISADVTVSGTAGATSGTVTEISPNNGTTYNVAVSNMSQSGTVIATIAAGMASDAAGNSSAAATFTDNQVTFDSDRPSATIDRAAGQADTTGFSPANFTVVFSRVVTGFETSDVTVTGTAGLAMIGTVTEVAPLDGTTFNVAVTGMTSSGTATVSIPEGAAEDGVGNPSLTPTIIDNNVTFAFVNPGVPVLTAPVSGALISGLQPLLNWNDSAPAAQYYRIQISTVGTFASLVIDQSNLSVSEFTPASDLVPGVQYYWRVRAFNAINGALGWSSVRNFRTPLDTPVLSSPIGGAVLNHDRPSFEWNDIAGATSYILQISQVSSFNSGLVTRTMTDSSYTMNVDLAQDKTLYWRVAAKTSTVISAWSASETFKTGNPPTVPGLSAPANNALVTTLTPFFNWSNSTIPANTAFSYYQLQVDDGNDFASPVMNKQIAGLASSQYQSVVGDNLQPNVTYSWRVRSVNTTVPGGVEQFSAWSLVRSFRSAMTKPVLVAPSNTTTPVLLTRRPTFDWDATNGAVGYQLHISTSASMSSLLVNTSTAATEYTPAADLPANKILFWRVRATGPNGPSLWSQVWTFKTGNPPTIPVLVAPAANALNTNYLPLFDWGNSTVPAGTFKYYEIQVDDNSNFQTTAFTRFTSNLVTDSKYQTQSGTDTLDPNTTYYWRVRAISTILGSGDHTSSWSAVRTLRTGLTPPASLTVTPNLITPAKPTFDWDDVPGSTGYTIQISRNANFSSPLVNATISGSSNSSYIPSVNLPLNQVLYWRVRANGTNTSGWSDTSYTITP